MKITDKDHLYESVVRNKYYVPNKDCPFVTLRYLYDVINEKVYAPKYEDVRLALCPRKPPKDELLNEVVQHLAQLGVTLGDTTKNSPES